MKKCIFMILYISFFFCSAASAITSTPEYSYVNDSVNISFLGDGTVNVSVLTPTNLTYNISTGVGSVIFPYDFPGASTSTHGNYTISIRAENGTLLDNGTIYIRTEPIARFVVGSDMHYINGSVNRVQNEFVQDINAEKWFKLPDAIFINGDISDLNAGLVDAKHSLDQLDAPYYPICAAHDSYWEDLAHRGDEYYRVFGGSYHYNLSINNINFVCMGSYMNNTSLMDGFDRYITYPLSRAWLDSVTTDSMPTVLIYHLPLLDTRTSGEAHGFGSMDNANADLVRGILEDNDVIMEVAGHNHIVSHVRQNNVSYICDGTIKSPLYYYRYFEVYNDHVNVHTIRQNDTPITSYIWNTSTDTLHPTVALYHEGNESERDFTISIAPITTETPIPEEPTPDEIDNAFIEFVDWNITSAYLATFQLSTLNESEWKFHISSTTSNISYVLYSISGGIVKTHNISGSDVVLNATIGSGTYSIIRNAPSIHITKYDPVNSSSNIEFILTNSSIISNMSIILNNTTSGRTYKIYSPSTNTVISQNTAVSTNVTLTTRGALDGIYRIAEVGAESIQFSYWNQSNATCNGIFSLSNSTPVSNVTITIASNGQGNRYVVYTMPSYTKIAEGTISGTENAVSMFGEDDGEYRIARVGTERIIFSFWNTSSYPIIGTFQLTNSTPFSIFNLSIMNSSRGTTYGLNISENNTTVEQQYAYSRITSLIHTGLVDGIYNVVILSEESNTFVKGIGTFVAVSSVIGAGYFWDRFRKKNRRT